MNEFNNRIEAQRKLLQLVNQGGWKSEELFGLSAKAIERWVVVNRLDPNAKLVQLVRVAAAKMFFLANKSQEQVSEEYRTASDEIFEIADAIKAECSSPPHA
jgi:hypothetical protein